MPQGYPAGQAPPNAALSPGQGDAGPRASRWNPFSRLLYLVLYTPGVGRTGWDWLWPGLAVVLDPTHPGASPYDAVKETGWRSA